MLGHTLRRGVGSVLNFGSVTGAYLGGLFPVKGVAAFGRETDYEAVQIEFTDSMRLG